MEEQPHRSYALIMAAYAALFGLVAARIRRDPSPVAETPPPRDLFLLGLATYHLSRLISYDKVTSFLRAPFVESGQGPLHPEGTREVAKGSGMRLAIGHLLTCSFCAGTWAAAINAYALTLFPRTGRLYLLILTAGGISQLVNPVFTFLNELPGFVKGKEELQQKELAR